MIAPVTFKSTDEKYVTFCAFDVSYVEETTVHFFLGEDMKYVEVHTEDVSDHSSILFRLERAREKSQERPGDEWRNS